MLFVQARHTHVGSLPTPSATPPPPTPPLSHTPPMGGHGGHHGMGPSRLNQQQQLAANAAAMAAIQMAGANGSAHMGGQGMHGGPGGRGHGLGRGGTLPVMTPPLPGSPEYQAAYQAAYQMALQQQQMQLMMSGMNPMGQVCCSQGRIVGFVCHLANPALIPPCNSPSPAVPDVRQLL